MVQYVGMNAKHDNGHGGKRPGAGRPAGPSDATIAKGNEIVERKLRSAAADGWEVLAGSYSDLMRRAVSVALGDEGKGTLPNITLLRTLLELMVKVVSGEPERKETVTDSIVKEFIESVRSARDADDGSSVGGGEEPSTPETNSGYISRTDSNSPISGMGRGDRFPSLD